MTKFVYAGKYRYALVFRVADDCDFFTESSNVQLVLTQILRAATEKEFEVTAYCFMPDHVHLLVEGLSDTADCKAFIRAAKQYSGYYFAQQQHRKLWQRYCYEHVLRDDFERATTIRYILDNPVTAGLSKRPVDYAFTGSSRYSLEELIQQAAPMTSA